MASAVGSGLPDSVTCWSPPPSVFSALTAVQLVEVRREIVRRVDRLDRAGRLARAAVDALVRVDEEHVVVAVEAVHRTDLDAVGEAAVLAVLGDDVRHGVSGRVVRDAGEHNQPRDGRDTDVVGSAGMMAGVRALLAFAGAIGAAFATLGAAATVAICQLAGAPAVVTAFAAVGGGAVSGMVGSLACMVLPAQRPWDPSGAVAALRDLLAGRNEEVRLPHDAPDELVAAIRDLAARLAEDRRAAVARESDLRETASRDVTELRSALQRLQAENDALEARFRSSLEVRDAFLARMSHELRTPLNAILGYVELLLDDAAGDAREDLERVRAAALNLLAIVTTVLDLTQLQSGSYDIQPEAIGVAGLLKQVVDSVRIAADANGNAVETTVDPQLEAILDRRMLQSILFNLVSNACKYTANGQGARSPRARPTSGSCSR